MASKITLYKCADDPRTVSKTLTGGAEYDFIARGAININRPTIRIQTATNLSEYNYAYIADYNRYYYIESTTASRADIWDFALRTDVLQTYASDIKALTGTVDRSETLRSGYLQDSDYQAQQYRQIVTKAFPNGMTDDTIILMTVG